MPSPTSPQREQGSPIEDSLWRTRERGLAAIAPDGIGLVVEFFKARDRFAHRVLCVNGESSLALFESVEGGDEDWPPSPPLQQLDQSQSENGRLALLLVGMAGRSHWSLSVEADPSSRSLIFDVACRASVAPRWLGSSYRPSGQARGWRLVVDAGHIDDRDGIAVCPDLSASGLPATLRWRYRFVHSP
jgi:hypothetical protein